MTKRNFNLNWICLIFIFPLLGIGYTCSTKTKDTTQYCTMDDFNEMIKIDAHCHIVTERTAFIQQAKEDNFRILTINYDLEVPDNGTVEEQQNIALYQRKAFPDRLAYLTTFSMRGWDSPDWQKNTLAYLEASFEKGAIGMKVWKNIGMVEKDKDGKVIMIDNPKFDTIFNYLEKKCIPICGHIGDPKNCWLPLEEIPAYGGRQYFEKHPEYHMYLHPEYPSYEDQIESRDNLLRKHPDLHFVGAHLGSMEWSLEEMTSHFDMFPNMSMDVSARISDLENHARNDWQRVHDFFIKYQDRIIYGTDQGDWSADTLRLKAELHEVWVHDWKFLTMDSTMTAREVNGQFKGLKLPRKVVEKIYYRNAQRIFPGI